MYSETSGGAPPSVALLFPGQGAQQARMGAALYAAEPVFAAAMDDFFAAAGDRGADLREDWLAADPGPEFDDCSRAQPLLYAVGVALATAVARRGVTPAALAGHSVGELSAAAAAGVFPLSEGARILQARTRAMAATPPGGMLAVAAGLDSLGAVLGPDVAVAAVNTPRQTVLSGRQEALVRVAKALTAAGVACNPVRARQAFHSPLCEDAAVQFAEAFRQTSLAAPRIPIYSTYTGAPVSPAQARTPEFWSVQLARPVRFSAAMDRLLATGRYLLFEAGPGGSCSSVLRRHPAIRSGRSRVLPLLPVLPGPDLDVFEQSLSEARTLATMY